MQARLDAARVNKDKDTKQESKTSATSTLAVVDLPVRRFAALATANRFAALATDDTTAAAHSKSQTGMHRTEPTFLQHADSISQVDPTPRDGSVEGCGGDVNRSQIVLGQSYSARQGALCKVASTFLAADAYSVDREATLLDSGSNVHILNDNKFFTEMHPYTLDIGTACGEASMDVMGEGTAVFSIPTDSGEVVELELHEVMFVPTVRCNLISLSALDKAGFEGKWGSGLLLIQHGGETLWSIKSTNGLYILPHSGRRPQILPDAKIAGNVDFNHPVWGWHARLGHPSIENMRKLLRNSTGMNLTDSQLKAKIKATCPTCATTKATVKVPRDPASREFEELGDLLHVDTWGPYSIKGYDGTKYFLFATDHATRYTWAVPCPNKEGMAERLILLHRKLEKQFKLTIRSYRLDSEFYRVDVLKDWCAKRGITFEPTIPYAYYMNGVAERANRTIREKTASNILHGRLPETITKILTSRTVEFLRECSEVPENLWPEAMKHAVHLKNRTPTRVKKSGKTPWELLRGTIPDLSIERTWGSKTFVTTPREM